MSSNLDELLKVRLAKGEISIDEYDEIVGKITQNSDNELNSPQKNKVNQGPPYLTLFLTIGLMILFVLLGADILGRWSPYTDRPFAILFLFNLVTVVFLFLSFKWEKLFSNGAVLTCLLSMMYFFNLSLDAFGYTSSITINLLLLFQVVLVFSSSDLCFRIFGTKS